MSKESPASSTLDSPSFLSKVATPTPAIDSDMSHVIDDATSDMNCAYDATTFLDKSVPLGELLDEQLARVRQNEITVTDDIIETGDYESPPRYELPVVPEGYLWMKRLLETSLLAMIERILRNCLLS